MIKSASRTLTRYDPQQVGALIHHMRTVAGLSQDGLGQALDLHRASIARMEAGTHRASLEDLMKMAAVCGFNMQLSVSRK